MQICDGKYIDGAALTGFKRRFVNYGGTGKNSRNNARMRISRTAYWCEAAGCHRVVIYADRKITAGQDIFMPYGPGWTWP